MKKSEKIAPGTVHSIPADVRAALLSNSKILEKWNSLTPLGRNEWICWVISVKKQETRDQHVRRLREELLQGKRRPCCWIGCIHRPDKPVSRSVRYVLKKRT